MNYTKGEWKAKMSADGSRIIYAEKEDGDELICRDVRHFNMDIIAQAPRMYEALIGAIEELKLHTTKWDLKMQGIILRGEQVLAKVEGKNG